MQVRLCVGIDWADDHHDVCLVSPDGSPEQEGRAPDDALCRFRISESAEGFAELHRRIRQYQSEPGSVCIALEKPHGILVHELLRSGYLVYAINPKAVNRYKDRHSAGSAKDDPRDALALAHLLRTDRYRFHPIQLKLDGYRLLEALCLDLRQMIAEQTRLVNRLQACLKDYHPQVLDIFDSLDTCIAAAFLRAFPDPAALKAASPKRFQSVFAKQHYTRPDRIAGLYELSRAPAPAVDPVAVESGRMLMLALLDQLATVRTNIGSYERHIRKLFESLPDNHNLPSLPGVGERLAPELAAILGPRPKNGGDGADPSDGTRSKRSERLALTTLAGCAPVTKQSGKYRNVSYRRACDKTLRRTLRDWAQSCTRSSRWAHAFYADARKRGQQHETALRNLGLKLVSILLHIWHTGDEYDEERHIANLKKHNVRWAMQL